MQLAKMMAWVGGCTALIITTAIVGCKKDEAPDWLVKEYETGEWAGEPGLLLVKTESEDSKVLLIRHRPMSEGLDELFGNTHEQPTLESDEVIYRYDPGTYANMFEAVDLRAWVEATGPAWWDVQQERRVPSRMHKPLAAERMAFGKHGFPIKGNQVMHMAQSMLLGSGKVAILSAKRVYDTPEGEGITFKEYYHQAYDTKALQLVGNPVPLPFESYDESPKCVWAGQDTYVVCTDAFFKRIFIVHRDRLIEEKW